MDRLSQNQHLMTREQQQDYNKLSTQLSHLKPNERPKGKYKLPPRTPSYWETKIHNHIAA